MHERKNTITYAFQMHCRKNIWSLNLKTLCNLFVKTQLNPYNKITIANCNEERLLIKDKSTT